MCELEEKAALMEAAPDIYFETDHYKGWPAMLARLDALSDAGLIHRLECAIRFQTAKSREELRQATAMRNYSDYAPDRRPVELVRSLAAKELRVVSIRTLYGDIATLQGQGNAVNLDAKFIERSRRADIGRKPATWRQYADRLEFRCSS